MSLVSPTRVLPRPEFPGAITSGSQKTMSEYQFVHFIAIDRPLDDEQLEFMQQQSTRATVTRREFTNEFTTSVAAEL